MRAGRRVILSPGQAWEGSPGAVYEPNVWWDGTTWNMIYSGGWADPALGWATASDPAGPWTKATAGSGAGQNPIIGQGNGGVAGDAARGTIFIDDDGTLYVYFSNASTSGPGIYVASGTGPASLAVAGSLALTKTGAQNTWVIKDGSTYRMIYEYLASGVWKLGYATASSPLGPFTVNTEPLSTLQVGTGSVSLGWFGKDGSTYVLWYHGTSSGVLPTNIYRATSTDLISWTQTGKVISYGVLPEEFDQVADVQLVVADGEPGSFVGGGSPATLDEVLLFWSGMNNTNPSNGEGVIILGHLPEWMDDI